MNSFDVCRELEEVSRLHLQAELIRELVYDGRYVRIEKGPMAREFQLTSGDYVWNSDELTAWRVEHKCEYANTYGNLFIETFSNLSTGKLGWFFTNGADLLLYHFVRSGEVYLLRLPELRHWLYQAGPKGKPNIESYSHKMQGRHTQLNDTWGYCVRLADIQKEIPVRTRCVSGVLLGAYEERLDFERSVRRNGQTEMWTGPDTP